MITVAPLLDEPAIAHEWRRMHIVGCRSRSDHLHQLRDELGVKLAVSNDVSRLHLLAMASEIETTDYAHRHSMLASLRVTAFSGEAQLHGASDVQFYNSKLGMRLQRDGGYVCSDCIDEDLASEHQISWFRRAHHLIGVDWCHKHGGLLHRVDSPTPFDGLPHIWRAEGLTTRLTSFCDQLPPDGFLRRYVDISVGLLARHRPVSCLALNQLISDRAKLIGLRGSKVGQRTLASDRLLDLADENWLQRHVVGIESKQRGVRFSRVDLIVTRHVTPAPGDGYALLLSTVYETAEDALGVLVQADDEERGGQVAPRGTVVKRYGDEFWQPPVWGAYVSSNGSFSAMSDKLNVSRNYLATEMMKIGLPSLSGIHTNQRWEALLSFVAGEALDVACKLSAVDFQTVENLVRTCIARVATAAATVGRRVGLKCKQGSTEFPTADPRSNSIDRSKAKENAELYGQVEKAVHAPKPLAENFWQSQAWTEYLESNGNFSAMAERLKIDRTTVNMKMARIGLPSLAGLQSNSRWAALIRFSQGATLAQACAIEEADTAELERILRACLAPVANAASMVRQRTPVNASGPDIGISDSAQRATFSNSPRNAASDVKRLKHRKLPREESQAA